MIALRDLFDLKFTRAGFAIQGLVDALVNREFNPPDGCQTYRVPNPELPGSKSAALRKILEGK